MNLDGCIIVHGNYAGEKYKKVKNLNYVKSALRSGLNEF